MLLRLELRESARAEVIPTQASGNHGFTRGILNVRELTSVIRAVVIIDFISFTVVQICSVSGLPRTEIKVDVIGSLAVHPQYAGPEPVVAP